DVGRRIGVAIHAAERFEAVDRQPRGLGVIERGPQGSLPGDLLGAAEKPGVDRGGLAARAPTTAALAGRDGSGWSRSCVQRRAARAAKSLSGSAARACQGAKTGSRRLRVRSRNARQRTIIAGFRSLPSAISMNSSVVG